MKDLTCWVSASSTCCVSGPRKPLISRLRQILPWNVLSGKWSPCRFLDLDLHFENGFTRNASKYQQRLWAYFCTLTCQRTAEMERCKRIWWRQRWPAPLNFEFWALDLSIALHWYQVKDVSKHELRPAVPHKATIRVANVDEPDQSRSEDISPSISIKFSTQSNLVKFSSQFKETVKNKTIVVSVTW